MAPFICGDLYKLLKSLMKRFVKPSVMKDITSAAKLAIYKQCTMMSSPKGSVLQKNVNYDTNLTWIHATHSCEQNTVSVVPISVALSVILK